MKDLNIHFVGYFIEKKDKPKFINLFDCKEKFYLEGSSKFFLYKKNTQFFPEILYKNINVKSYTALWEKIFVDPLVKELYKHDLKYFKGASVKKLGFSKLKMMIFLFIYSTTQYMKKNNKISKFNIFKIVRTFYKTLKNYKRKDPKLSKKLLLFMFRLKFIAGYNYSKQLLENRAYSQDDVYIIWGKSYSSRILLINHLEKYKIPFFIAEYGEVPGTISCSPNGIFGEIFSEKTWNELYQKNIEEKDIKHTKVLLDKIKKEQISTRNYGENMYFLMKYFYDNSIKKDNTQKIIYVNGAELFSSGLYYNRWNINNNRENPNKMLLENVVSFFKNKDYLIMYKEHPMTVKQSKNTLLDPSDFPTVNFISSMDIYDIIEISDIIITFPSKVVITSLLYQKTTFVLGDFTIINSIPSMKYFTSRNFKDISEVLNANTPDDMESFIDFIARLIKYSLIVFDDNIHHNFNYQYEQKKINKILDSRKNQYVEVR